MTNLMLWDDLRCYLVRFAPFQFFLLYDVFLSLFIDDPKLLLREKCNPSFTSFLYCVYISLSIEL